jgi:hypothetical protein
LVALFFCRQQIARTVIAVSTLCRIDSRLIKIQSELILLKWMVGFWIGLNVAILMRLFVH